MPAAQTVMVKLSAPRGEQLRAYAAREGLSVTNAIGALLKLANAADTVPGFEIERAHPDAPAYRFTFDGFSVIDHASRWLAVADSIDHVALNPGDGPQVHNFPDVCRELCVVRGTGASVFLRGLDRISHEVTPRMLPLDVAIDLAAQLRRAVS